MPSARRLAAAFALLGVVAAPAAVLASPAGAAEGDLSTVTVVHGIPGEDLGVDPELPVDVLVNGSICALTDLRFGDVSDRLELAAGSYDLEVKLSDGSCGGDTAISADDVELPAGVNASIVANLDADGAPTLSVFLNDLSPTERYQARVEVHHLAAAPAVDVTLTHTWGGRRAHPFVSVEGLENGQQAIADTWVGPYEADIAPAGGESILNAPLTLLGNQVYAVYAVGSLANGTLTVIVDAQPTEGASH